jgi:hypothetical protein
MTINHMLPTEITEGTGTGRLTTLRMTINHMLPTEGLPASGYPAGAVQAWMEVDNLEGYRKRGGHPVYGEHDVVYRFNSLGYRSAEFDSDAEVRIVAIGCSYVFGLGLAQDDLFHERFAARIRADLSKSAVVWNLGKVSVSNDYVSRLLHFAVSRLDPHVVLINFTHTARREYVSVQNRDVNYIPSWSPSDDVGRDIFGHFSALSSPYDDQLNFFKNYKAVELLLAERCWLYSNFHRQEIEPVAAHMDLGRYVGSLPRVDRARDGSHPGPESHKILAGLFWDKFVEIGGIQSIVTDSSMGQTCGRRRVAIDPAESPPGGGRPARADYQGALDLVSCEKIAGWAWDPHQPDRRLDVEISEGQTLLATITADRPRPDLRQAGKGDGRHGFLFPASAALRDGRPHTIRAMVVGADAELNGPPRSITHKEQGTTSRGETTGR